MLVSIYDLVGTSVEVSRLESGLINKPKQLEGNAQANDPRLIDRSVFSSRGTTKKNSDKVGQQKSRAADLRMNE